MTDSALVSPTKVCGVLPEEANLMVTKGVVSHKNLVYVEVALQLVSAKARKGFIHNSTSLGITPSFM